MAGIANEYSLSNERKRECPEQARGEQQEPTTKCKERLDICWKPIIGIFLNNETTHNTEATRVNRRLDRRRVSRP